MEENNAVKRNGVGKYTSLFINNWTKVSGSKSKPIFSEPSYVLLLETTHGDPTSWIKSQSEHADAKFRWQKSPSEQSEHTNAKFRGQ